MTEQDSDPRTDPPLAGDEVATLRGFLGFLRHTMALKTDGLDAVQMSTALAPSTMTLGGMLKHLALVESHWFYARLGDTPLMAPFDTVEWRDDPDWEWRTAADDSPDDLRQLWATAVTASDAATDAALATPERLDTLSRYVRPDGERFSLRWILTHMIEEYARHLGHADLIRESIDGSVGE